MTHVRQVDGLLIRTDTTCVLGKQVWEDIPTLVWPEGIDEVASDWFRTLVVDYGLSTLSAFEYAKTLRPFLRYCRGKRDWRTVDDNFLIVWREYLYRTQALSVQRVNRSLQTVFAFYRWAEETRRLRFHVGIYAIDQLPAAMHHVPFPISANQRFSKGRNGRVFGSWTTPLMLSGARQNSVVRHTPTESEIRKLHEIATDGRYGERDSLILSWAEETGARRAEILRVCGAHMPTLDALADLIERDEPWKIHVQRKGGKKTALHVPPDLLIKTLDFLQYERAEIVKHCHANIARYKEPDEIFLSGRTGQVLHVDSVTSIGYKAFRKAGIKKANVHRLRARFAVRIIETLVDSIFSGESVDTTSAWVETILIKAAEMMGHSSPTSLRPYLNYVLNRRIVTSDSTAAERSASKLRLLELQEGSLVRRIAQYREMLVAASHLSAGRRSDAAAALLDIVNEIQQTP